MNVYEQNTEQRNVSAMANYILGQADGMPNLAMLMTLPAPDRERIATAVGQPTPSDTMWRDVVTAIRRTMAARDPYPRRDRDAFA